MEIPAGKLDYKGEDRLEAAKRELREETGLTAEKWEHLTDIVTAPGFCDELISIYLATGLSSGEDEPDEDEFLNVEVMSFDDLLAQVMDGTIEDAKTVAATLEMGGVALITADHGNADKMYEPDGSPFTAHTTFPVPFCVVGKDCTLREGGRLADIAPTMLQILGLEQPAEMSGESLIAD